MAGPYYVDDGGNNTTGLSWANAFTSINSLQGAVTLASDEIVYFGADSQCQATNSANLTITGPTSGNPVKFISATVGTTTYSKGTGNQIDTTEANTYNMVFDGSFALYGIRVKSGRHVQFMPDADEVFYTSDCTLAVGATGVVFFSAINSGNQTDHSAVTIDLAQDLTTDRSTVPIQELVSCNVNIAGLSFTNPGYRTGTVFGGASVGGSLRVSGADFSGFTNATVCELFDLSAIRLEVTLANSKTAGTWTPFSGTAQNNTNISLYNVGPDDQPTALIIAKYAGNLISSSAIYRSGGADAEGVNTAWLITTTAACCEGAPFYTPWMLDAVSTTGSKTFSLYLVNDSIDFTNAEVWLEIEYLATADTAIWTKASSQRATITTTPATLTSDASTWNGSGPSFSYKRKLSITATVGEEGQYRARLAVARPSVSSSAYLYVDPKVVVT